MLFAGIDYGNKLAGTTVIAAPLAGQVHFFQSKKKQDADLFIRQWADTYRPATLFLDAPLSLPRAYFEPDPTGNFFYREADRLVGAMSPMFLGGLTARAMSLTAQLKSQNIRVWEVYPRQMAKKLELEAIGYKKDPHAMLPCWEKIAAFLPYPMIRSELSWHHIDAALALCSGWRFENMQHESFGDPAEGVIIV